MHEICDISTPLLIFSTSEKGCFTEILVAKLFQNFKFFDPNTYKTTLFLLHMAPWIFGVEGITLGDPGLEIFVLLSRNMPDYGTIVWFAGTCLEKFSKFFGPLWNWRVFF